MYTNNNRLLLKILLVCRQKGSGGEFDSVSKLYPPKITAQRKMIGLGPSILAPPLWTNVGNHDRSSFLQRTPKQGVWKNTPYFKISMIKFSMTSMTLTKIAAWLDPIITWFVCTMQVHMTQAIGAKMQSSTVTDIVGLTCRTSPKIWFR